MFSPCRMKTRPRFVAVSIGTKGLGLVCSIGFWFSFDCYFDQLIYKSVLSVNVDPVGNPACKTDRFLLALERTQRSLRSCFSDFPIVKERQDVYFYRFFHGFRSSQTLRMIDVWQVRSDGRQHTRVSAFSTERTKDSSHS
jgi:hypothetical protein